MLEAVILLLLQDMGDHSFKVRERATFQVATLNYFWDSRMLLRKHGLTHKDPEVRRRTKSVLDDYESPIAGPYPRIESIGDCGDEKAFARWCEWRAEPPGNLQWQYDNYQYWIDREDRWAAIYFAHEMIQTRSRWEVVRILNTALMIEKQNGINVVNMPEGWQEPETP